MCNVGDGKVGGRYIFPIKMLPIISDLRSGKPSFTSEGNWNLIAYDLKKKKKTLLTAGKWMPSSVLQPAGHVSRGRPLCLRLDHLIHKMTISSPFWRGPRGLRRKPLKVECQVLQWGAYPASHNQLVLGVSADSPTPSGRACGYPSARAL